MRSGRAARNPAARKRRESFSRVISKVKRFAWRSTAIWCWLHIASLLIAREDIFSGAESQLSAIAYRSLVHLGFTPSNPHLLPFFSKAFWVHMPDKLLLGSDSRVPALHCARSAMDHLEHLLFLSKKASGN